MTAWQERAWGEVAQQLGLGWDPAAAHKLLSKGFPDPQVISAQQMMNQLGPEFAAGLYPGSMESLEAAIQEYKDLYFVEPPTAFDEPGLQSTMAQLLDEATPVIAEVGYPLTAQPRVATLPSPYVHARTQTIPGTDEAAILFQHGLMLFLNSFTKVLAFALPFPWLELGIAPPGNEMPQPGDPEHIDQAIELLGDSLAAFVVDGNPQAAPHVTLEGYAVVTASTILHHMELTVLCHELAHLLLGHLLPATKVAELGGPTWKVPWDKEYDADSVGCVIARRTAAGSGVGLNNVVALWVSDLALAALDVVERCVSYLTQGDVHPPWSKTHPPTMDRRTELLRRNIEGLTEAGGADEAARLQLRIRESNELIEKMWLATMPRWDELRRKSVLPSPIWAIA